MRKTAITGWPWIRGARRRKAKAEAVAAETARMVAAAIGGGVNGDEVLKSKERTARSEAQGWRRASVKLLVAWCHGGESATTALRRRLSTGKDKAHTRVPHRSYS
ncbi:hypothetical protein ACFX16_010945 [Malus domestica]